MQSDDNGTTCEEGKQGWKIDKLAEESSQISGDEIQRQVLRGDETKGDADERDHAGRTQSKDTPQGREEAKPDHKGAANTNG